MTTTATLRVNHNRQKQTHLSAKVSHFGSRRAPLMTDTLPPCACQRRENFFNGNKNSIDALCRRAVFSHSYLSFFFSFFPVFFSYILVTCKRWSIYIYIIYICVISIYIYIYVCLCIYYFILIDFPSTRQAIIHNHTHTSAKKTRRKRGEGGGLCHFGIPFRRGGKGGGSWWRGERGQTRTRDATTFLQTRTTNRRRRKETGAPLARGARPAPPTKAVITKGPAARHRHALRRSWGPRRPLTWTRR